MSFHRPVLFQVTLFAALIQLYRFLDLTDIENHDFVYTL